MQSTKAVALLVMVVAAVLQVTLHRLGYSGTGTLLGLACLGAFGAYALDRRWERRFEWCSQVASQIRRRNEVQARHIVGAVNACMELKVKLPELRLNLNAGTMQPANLMILLDALDRHKPRSILEFGAGASTLVAAAWLDRLSGREAEIHTIEHDEYWANSCRAELEEHGLSQNVTIHVLPLQENEGGQKWYKGLSEVLEGLRIIDLVVVDAPPAQHSPHARGEALPSVVDKLSRDAVVLLDDGNREGESAIVREWTRRYPGWDAVRYDTLSGIWVLKRNLRDAKSEAIGQC